MGIGPKNAENKLKIKMGASSTHVATPEIECKSDNTSLLNGKYSRAGRSGPLKFSAGLHKSNASREELPKPAHYPWHALSLKKTESLDTEDIILEPANAQEKPQKLDWISVVFQPLGALLAIVVLLVILHVTGAGMSMGLYMLIGGVTGVLGILWGVIRYRSQKKESIKVKVENEEKYRAYLGKMDRKLIAIAEKQQRILNADYPSVQESLKLNERSPRLWSCDIEDSSFLTARLGSGRTSLSCKVIAPTSRYADENSLNDEARSLADKHAFVENIPIVCNLRKVTTLGIVGERTSVVEQTLSLIVSLATRYSYEDLKIAFIYPSTEKNIWEEARFVPHVFNDGRDYRFMADNAIDANAMIQYLSDIVTARKEEQSSFGFSSRTLFRPYYLVVFADTSLAHRLRVDDPELGVSCIYLASSVNRLPSHCIQIAELEDGQAKIYDKSASDVVQRYIPDFLPINEWKEFSRRIAPIRLETPKVKAGIPRSLSFMQMKGISEPTQLDIGKEWRSSNPDKSMNVVVGAGEGSFSEEFDISQNKCGPNGIFVGTAGSGKTSMVRSWILSMAVSFSPEDVNFVLIDFREPGLINGLEKLPHVVGTIGRLDADSGDIYRNLIALKSEMDRRQRLFKKTGSVSIYDYRRKRAAGNENAKEPLSFLFIVVDELNEFKLWDRDSAGSDWMTTLDSLYQIGRGLGIQIVAGSQTTGPFTSVMDGNANFRWCLRTQMKEESRALLGTEDAYFIRNKGRVFMRVGGDIKEIQPAYADGVFYTEKERMATPEREIAAITLTGERITLSPPVEDRKTELDLTVEHILAFANKNNIHAPWMIWPSRLPDCLRLDQLPDPQQKDALCAVVGLLDDPVKQIQYPMEIKLAQYGSFLIYGATRTGKTNFLQTFTYSLLKNNSPDYLETYIVESNVGDFAGFEAFPQVRQIASADNSDEIISRVSDTLSKRRSKPAEAKDKHIVLVVDGLNALMGDHERKTKILKIVQNGSGLGIYLVGSAMNMIGMGSVCHIGDQTKRGFSFWVDYSRHSYYDLVHDKNVKAIPPADIPGRGVTSIGRVVSFQSAILFGPEEVAHQREKLREKASLLWGAYKRVSPPNDEHGAYGFVTLGDKIDKSEPVIHDFTKSASLLVLCDDYDKRLEVMTSVARQMYRGTNIKAKIAIDLPKDRIDTLPNFAFMSSGKELDEYLLNIKEDLSARGKLSLEEGHTHSPYCFIIPDLAECLENSKASERRIDNNLILCGRSFSVFSVFGCSYSEFTRIMLKEMDLINQGVERKIPVPAMRLARGRCLLLDTTARKLNSFFLGKYSFPQNGDYYLAGEEAIPLFLRRGGAAG